MKEGRYFVKNKEQESYIPFQQVRSIMLHSATNLSHEVISVWMSKSEYKVTIAFATNYIVYTNTAEELLWETAPSMLLVVTKIDELTQMAYYMTENDGGGKIYLPKTQAPSIEIGNAYKAYTRKHPTKNYSQVVRLTDTDEKVTWFKKFMGAIRINASGIGFVGNAYVAANLVAMSKLRTDMPASGFAIKCHDHKKNQEGWKVISINKMEQSTE